MHEIKLEDLAESLTLINTKLDTLLTEAKKEATTDGREWLTVDQAAEICGFKPWTLRQACSKGRLSRNDAKSVRKLDDGTWRIWWEAVASIRDNGLPKAS